MAGGIPHGFIDDLLARTDIVILIGESVTLKKKGREYMACCPFHNEKTPSFSVSSDKQFYYCFGCGVSGNAIGFLMAYQHLEFTEAVETLAQRLGLEVPRERGAVRHSAGYQQQLDVLEQVANFYVRQLQMNATAQHYLQQRGLDEDTVNRFRIGYAPAGFDNLKKLPIFADNEKWFFKAGLLSQKVNNIYARFRDRLMFPIRNRRGQVIAFGGRVMADGEQAKYLNSPETEMFQKRKTLYGSYELKYAGRLDRIIVVEGYMDVVSLAAHGIDSSVATLGTAVTQQHVQQLFKLCKRIVFCFDGDPAGYKAAAVAMEQSLSVFRDGYEINFAFLPEQEDPDSIVNSQGKEGLETLIAQAVPLSEFLFSHLTVGLDLSVPEGGATFAERARPLLDTMPQGTFRELMLTTLADKAQMKTEHFILKPKTTVSPKVRPASLHSAGRYYSTIRIVALLLVKNPNLVNADDMLSSADIKKLKQPGAEFLAAMIDDIKSNVVTNTASLLELYRDTEHADLVGRLAGWLPPQTQNEEAEFRQAMHVLHLKLNDQEKEELIDISQTRDLSEEEKQRFRKL